jgi:hypothetical protein
MRTEGTMRERAFALLAFTRYALSVPPARWPFSWHVTLAAMLATCLAALLAGHKHWEQSRVTAAQQRLNEAKRELASITAATPTRSEIAPYGPAGYADSVVEAAGKFAAVPAIRIVSLRVESTSVPSTNSIAQWRLVFKCTGEYTGIKSWITELTGRYPWLALASITLRPVTPDSPVLDVNATFELYQKAST